MERPRLSDHQLANLIMRINGEIEPIGETNTDNERLNNLIGLQSILEILLDEIFEVCRYHDRPEASMSAAGKQALIWIMDIQEQINYTIIPIKNLDKSGDNNE